MANQWMAAEEALGRLANACGDHSVQEAQEACWELEAMKRAGWKVSMILGDDGFTIVLKKPEEKL